MTGVVGVRFEEGRPRHERDHRARDKRAYKYNDVTRHEMSGWVKVKIAPPERNARARLGPFERRCRRG